MSDAAWDCEKEQFQNVKRRIARNKLERVLLALFKKRSKKNKTEVSLWANSAGFENIDARLEKFLSVAKDAINRSKTRKNSRLFNKALEAFVD